MVRKRSGCWWCATAYPLVVGARQGPGRCRGPPCRLVLVLVLLPRLYTLFGLLVSACGDSSSLCLHYRRLAFLLRPLTSSCSDNADAARDAGLVPGIIRGGASGAEFLSLSDLCSLSALRRFSAFGRLVTTLFQTTGRIPSDLSVVNLTSLNSSSAVLVRSSTPFSSSFANSNTTALGLVTSFPYNVSVFVVDAILILYDFDLAASKTPIGVNITRVLIEACGFNVVAPMLERRAEKRGGDSRGA